MTHTHILNIDKLSLVTKRKESKLDYSEKAMINFRQFVCQIIKSISNSEDIYYALIQLDNDCTRNNKEFNMNKNNLFMYTPSDIELKISSMKDLYNTYGFLIEVTSRDSVKIFESIVDSLKSLSVKSVNISNHFYYDILSENKMHIYSIALSRVVNNFYKITFFLFKYKEENSIFKYEAPLYNRAVELI